jgi:acyl carrier protein
MSINRQIHGVQIEDICKVVDEALDFKQPSIELLDSSVTALGADSIEVMQLNLDLEKKYQLSIDFDQMNSNTTIQQMIEQLKPYEA